jgi:hypothetical protein
MGIKFNPFTGNFDIAGDAAGGGGGLSVVNTDPGSPAVGDVWILHTLPTGTGDLIAGDANVEFIIPVAFVGSLEVSELDILTPPNSYVITAQVGGPSFNYIPNDPVYGLIVEFPTGTTFSQLLADLNQHMSNQGFPGTFATLLNGALTNVPVPTGSPITFPFVPDGVPESVVLKFEGVNDTYTVNLI